MSLFGAGWTVGTIEAFSAADSLTLYETTGWRGLMEDTDGPALPELFPSRPGMVFPFFYVFADLAGWKRCELAGCRPSHPRETAALALIRGEDVLVLIANLTAVDQTVELEGDIAGGASVRMLDDSSVTEWSSDPSAFYVRGEEALVEDGRLTLGIQPSGMARVVASRSSRVR